MFVSTFCIWKFALEYLFLNVLLFVSDFSLFFVKLICIFKYFIVLNFYGCYHKYGCYPNDMWFGAFGISGNSIVGRWRIKRRVQYNSVLLLFSRRTLYKYAISDVTRILAHSRCTQSYSCDSRIHVSCKSFYNAFTTNMRTPIVINTNDGVTPSHTYSPYILENRRGETASLVLCVCLYFIFYFSEFNEFNILDALGTLTPLVIVQRSIHVLFWSLRSAYVYVGKQLDKWNMPTIFHRNHSCC